MISSEAISSVFDDKFTFSQISVLSNETKECDKNTRESLTTGYDDENKQKQKLFKISYLKTQIEALEKKNINSKADERTWS